MSPGRPGSVYGRGGERLAWRLFGLAMTATLAVCAWDFSGRWHTPGHELRNFIMLGLYWGPKLAGPFLLWGLVAHALGHPGWARLKAVLALAFVVLGLWASWVEPFGQRVRQTTLSGLPEGAQPVKLAVIADIHWGLFYRDFQLRRLVATLNDMDVDAVLVAGDWVHDPQFDLVAGLRPLADIRHPVFAVLGNHDTKSPGPDLTGPLREALRTHGVRLIEGEVVAFKGWQLAGLSDLWGGRPQDDVRALWPQGQVVPPRLVLVHQPDTMPLLPPGAAFLAFAGHTHGGQVWIPGFTPWFVRHTNTARPWVNGLYDTPGGRLLVTPGLGTIGLPARLGVWPTIERVELRE